MGAHPACLLLRLFALRVRKAAIPFILRSMHINLHSTSASLNITLEIILICCLINRVEDNARVSVMVPIYISE